MSTHLENALYRLSLLAVMLCVLPQPRANAEAGPVAVRVQIGVPVPLTVYGVNAQSDGITHRYPAYAELGVAVSLSPRWAVGTRLGGATVVGDDGVNDATAWWLSFGPELRVALWQPSGSWLGGLAVVGGPAALRNVILVDENIRLDTWSVGGRGALSGGLPLTSGWALDATVGVEVYAAPLDKETWFNKPLGRTALLTIAVGVIWAPGPG